MKKRYISIFLLILLASAFLVYHLYPRDMKDIVIEDRSIIDSIKVYFCINSVKIHFFSVSDVPKHNVLHYILP